MAKKPDRTKVVGYDRAGDASVLELRVKPLSAPAADEVTVEMICAGISHIDGFIRDGREKSVAWRGAGRAHWRQSRRVDHCERKKPLEGFENEIEHFA